MNSDDSDKKNENEVELKIETTLSKEKRLECRHIVQEIRNIQISQRQTLFLIELLALELEDRNIMLSILNSVKANREKVGGSILELPSDGEN